MTSGLLALYPAVRGVIFVGLMLLVGAQVAGVLLRRWREQDPQLKQALHLRLDPLLRWVLAALIGAILARGALQVLSLVDPGEAITADLVRNALLSGSWGSAWLLQVVAAATALGVLLYRRNGITMPDRFTIAAVGVILWAQTGMGHAASDTWPGPVGRIVDLTHLAGIGLWLGTLAVLLFVAMPLLRKAPSLAALAAVVREYSIYARTGAALVVASGVAATLVYTGGSIAIIPHSTWGKLLLLKLACLLGVLALGWYNWRIVTPALERYEANCSDRFCRAIKIELALGMLMLGITAVLVASALPGEG